jgi:hypothetical protein
VFLQVLIVEDLTDSTTLTSRERGISGTARDASIFPAVRHHDRYQSETWKGTQVWTYCYPFSGQVGITVKITCCAHASYDAAEG